MTQIISDNKVVQTAIEKLVATIRENNGYVHPGMIIHCRQGQLSIHASGEEMQGSWLFRVPHSCLVPIGPIKWGMDADNIVIKSVSQNVTQLQEEIANQMIDIFNKMEKMKHYRQASLLLRAKKYRDLIVKLFEVRHFSAREIDNMSRRGKDTDLYVFLLSRVYSSKKNADSLVPLIDFLNHHYLGALFRNSLLDASLHDLNGAGNQPFLGVRCSCPLSGADECFVNYCNYKDAHDIFLSYQYIDEYIPFMRSVPMDIDLGATGTLRINAAITMPGFKNPRGMPPELAPLWFFLPPFRLKGPGKEITLGYLYIPGQDSPWALRQVLSLFIRKLNRYLPDRKLQELIAYSENKILKKNINYFNSLKVYIRNTVPAAGDEYFFAMVKKLAEIQIDKIRKYSSFHGLQTKMTKRKAARTSDYKFYCHHPTYHS